MATRLPLPVLVSALLLGAVSGARAQEPARPPAEALLRRLAFHGTAQEQAFYEGLTERLLESPTARELAAETVAQPGPVDVAFADLPDTELYERATGRSAFTAPEAGHTLRQSDRAAVVLSGACLRIDPEYAAVDCARILAHELFGHALGWLRAQTPEERAAYVYYDDEYEARLVGWIVTVELTGRLDDPEAACALADPSAYRRRIQATYPSSSASLSLEEFADPVAAWSRRRALDLSPKARAFVAEQLSYFQSAGAPLSLLTAAARDPFFQRLPDRVHWLEARLRSHDEALFHANSCSDYL